MSLSIEERNHNLYYALDLFVRDIGTNWIGRTMIQPGGTPEYDVIINTTWEELITKGYLESKSDGHYYLLTGTGWRVGMERLGKKDNKEFDDILGKLGAVLKGPVKARNDPQFLFPQNVATETGHPEGLIGNIIDGKLFERWKRRHGPEWASYKDRGELIKVPIRFDLPLL